MDVANREQKLDEATNEFEKILDLQRDVTYNLNSRYSFKSFNNKSKDVGHIEVIVLAILCALIFWFF